MPAPENDPDKSSVWTRHHSLPQWPLVFASRRAFRIYLFALVCVATLIAFAYAEEDWRGHHAWTQFAGRSKARGFSLDMRDYVPPPVPDDQNFAMTPPFAGLFDYEWTATNVLWRDTNIWQRVDRFEFGYDPKKPNLGEWMYGRALNLAAWQNYFRHGHIPDVYAWPVPPQTGQPSKDVLFSLKKIGPDLEALRVAAARPLCRFPIHYDELPTALIVHVIYLTRASEALELRACAELDSGDTAAAFADTQLIFRLADSLESEPIAFAAFDRCHIFDDAIQPVWEGLAAHRWSEEQLKAFEDRFSSVDLVAAFARARHAHAAFTCAWIESLKTSFASIGLLKNHSFFRDDKLAHNLIPSGWIDQNAVTAGRFFSEAERPEFDVGAQRVFPDIAFANSQLFDSIRIGASTFAFKEVSFAMSPQTLAHTQTDLNLALVACALERFRLSRGQYPASLTSLSDYLAKPPHDLITGESLEYIFDPSDEFMLYSVGWNKADDHGASPSPPPRAFTTSAIYGYHPETGDWVWKYPSSR
jgi:hypothetical protein